MTRDPCTKVCELCDGSGLGVLKKGACPTCHGTGRVSMGVEEMADELLREVNEYEQNEPLHKNLLRL